MDRSVDAKWHDEMRRPSPSIGQQAFIWAAGCGEDGDPGADAAACDTAPPDAGLADADDLAVTGLGETIAIAVTPEGRYTVKSTLLCDGFTGGEHVTLTAAGHLTPAFVVEANAPADLDHASPGAIDYVTGEDLELT